MKKILLAEDNANVNIFNTKMLKEKGFEVISVLTLSAARNKLKNYKPDLIVLDVGMPDGSGFDFLKEVREYSDIPVLMLTGFSDDKNVVAGFNAGCDDYLSKPYSFEVLLARINRLLKSFEKAEIIVKGKLKFNLLTMQAFILDEDLMLTPKDFSLLHFMAVNEDKELCAEEIFAKVWGQPLSADKKALINAVSRLRKKLVDSGYTINSVYGKGYIFEK